MISCQYLYLALFIAVLYMQQLYILEENTHCTLFETLDFLSSDLEIILLVCIVQMRKRFSCFYFIYEIRMKLMQTFHMKYN